MKTSDPKRSVAVCERCGSHNVAADGSLGWDVETQEFSSVITAYDNTDCHDCGGECHISYVDEGEPEPTEEEMEAARKAWDAANLTRVTISTNTVSVRRPA